ncbi:MAG: hypothetical protein HQK58_02905 [Deltaproteobacteria bacterium]|nr:hypothetical protein [Deltaproteobacteria bacterium]
MSDKIDSGRLLRAIWVYSVLGTLIVGIVVATVSVAPLYHLLKQEKARQLVFAVRDKSLAVNECISSQKAIDKQISSRSVLREKLEAYNRGEVSREEMINFSKDRLTEATRQSKEIAGLVRLDILGRPIIRSGITIPEKAWTSLPQSLPEPIIHGPILIDRKLFLVVKTSIGLDSSRQEGSDVVLFKIDKLKQIVLDRTGLGETGEIVLGMNQGKRMVPIFPRRLGPAGMGESADNESSLNLALEKSLRQESGILSTPSSEIPYLMA